MLDPVKKIKKNVANDIKSIEILERIICTNLSTLCHDNLLNKKLTQFFSSVVMVGFRELTIISSLIPAASYSNSRRIKTIIIFHREIILLLTHYYILCSTVNANTL